MAKRGDLVDANEFVVKVEIRLKLKREDLADSSYFGVRRQVCGFQFAITLLLETVWLLSVYQMTNLNWIVYSGLWARQGPRRYENLNL